MSTDIGKVQSTEITSELSTSYLDYAMSVIVARALPDVRDGLKPVHRRILYAMHLMGLHYSTSGTTKSAKVVGEVLGKYHPHGDMAVYDAMVRLAQTFSMRYPLVHGQGNFGSVDGDPAAAMRYTEVKLAKIADNILVDMEKETVDFTDNFDSTLKEPVYLPALLPNLLLMGSEGIAVGMATKIPPHNLTELVDAITEIINKGRVIKSNSEEPEVKNQETHTDFIIKKINLVASGSEKALTQEEVTPSEISFESDVTIEDLVKFVPGPDFPTGGAIYDAASLNEVYATGRGRIVVRGIAEITEGAKGKPQIVITELPYQVNKAELVAKIAELVKDKKVIGIADLRDESDKDGMRVAVDLKRDAKPKSVLNNLFKHTKLQSSFSANFVALVDGTPHTLNLKQILVEYVKHRQRVVTRRTIFDLTEAKKRAHILEGLKKALEYIDAIIKLIRASDSQDEALKNLMKKFSFTERQATAILEMKLRALAGLERKEVLDELDLKQKFIKEMKDILANPKRVLKIILDELAEIRTKYNDERRTKIVKSGVKECLFYF